MPAVRTTLGPAVASIVTLRLVADEWRGDAAPDPLISSRRANSIEFQRLNRGGVCVPKVPYTHPVTCSVTVAADSERLPFWSIE